MTMVLPSIATDQPNRLKRHRRPSAWPPRRTWRRRRSCGRRRLSPSRSRRRRRRRRHDGIAVNRHRTAEAVLRRGVDLVEFGNLEVVVGQPSPVTRQRAPRADATRDHSKSSASHKSVPREARRMGADQSDKKTVLRQLLRRVRGAAIV